jgi:DNA-binding NarL/FixJ family response regulator
MKLLLIDDHTLFREGLALLVQPLATDAGSVLELRQAGSVEEALLSLESEGAADLVLMDIGLPGASGLEGIALVRNRFADTTVVALSSADDRDTVLRAIDAGAMGFIPKSASSAVMLAALRLVLARGVYLPPSAFVGVAPQATTSTPTGSAPGPLPHGQVLAATPLSLGLSPRQGQVLYLILQGKPAKLIERELGLSASTVKAHTSAVLRALNVTTRTQAVVAAGRLGLRFEAPVAGPTNLRA